MSEAFTFRLRILHVNLTDETTWTEVWEDPESTRGYLGGVGWGAEILWKELPRNCKAEDPENRIVFTTGPLTGTGAPGSGCYCLTTIGPLGQSMTSAQSNGFFGAYMRFAGYDIIVVSGAAKTWRYLYIRDGEVRFGDATPFLGMDTWQTDDAMKASIASDPSHTAIAGIGPAGEHLVKFAGVFNDKGHLASTNGPGCVMGYKKLKAIVVEWDRKDLPFADWEGFAEVRRRWVYEYNENAPTGQGTRWTGTLGSVAGMSMGGLLPIKNYHSNVFPGDVTRFDAMKLKPDPTYEFKPTPCYGCPWSHCHSVKIKKGRFEGLECDEPEYEGVASMSGLIGNCDDPEGMMALTSAIDHMGLCTKESGFTLAMAIEAFEAGILTLEDTDGLEMTWGNVDAVLEAIRRIAHREGKFGNLLAEGAMRASKAIGHGAENMAVYFKNGIAPHIHDQRLQHSRMLSYCVSDYGANMVNPVENVIDGHLGIDRTATPFDPEDIVHYFILDIPSRIWDDGLGLCMFFTWGGDADYPRRALNCATGWDIDFPEMIEAGYRVIHLERCINLWVGKTAEDDVASPRAMETPVDPPFAVVSPKVTLPRMKELYYRQMGWDPVTTKPLPETLEKYGLKSVLERYELF